VSSPCGAGQSTTVVVTISAAAASRSFVAVAAAYCGSVEEGERVVQPLRELAEPLVDASGPWPWLGLQSGFDAIFPKGELRYWKSRSVAELSDEVIAEIVELAGRRPAPLTDIVIWHHGGAMTRVGETETAYGGRDAPFLVTAEANWTDPLVFAVYSIG
jgi:hypothetical protein